MGFSSSESEVLICQVTLPRSHVQTSPRIHQSRTRKHEHDEWVFADSRHGRDEPLLTGCQTAKIGLRKPSLSRGPRLKTPRKQITPNSSLQATTVSVPTLGMRHCRPRVINVDDGPSLGFLPFSPRQSHYSPQHGRSYFWPTGPSRVFSINSTIIITK